MSMHGNIKAQRYIGWDYRSVFHAVSCHTAIAMYRVTRVTRLLGGSSGFTFLFRPRTQVPLYISPWVLQKSTIHNNAAAQSTKPIQDGALDSLEMSSQAKWMADAATVTLPNSQGGELASIGLGGYNPVGILQSSLEFIHVSIGLPWWASIISCTVLMRLALFPLVIKLQRNAARMNNIRPQMDKIMAKIKQYQQTGNSMMAAQESTRLMQLYKEHDCNPIKMMAAPLLQVPIFLSFFVAIRRMASAPVESMKTGGTLWFTDLTLSDPFYVLPCTACAMFIITIELGGETGVTNPQFEKMKFFFRCMAILLVPVTASFPSGLFMYWLTASVFSLSQILLLKVPSVRAALKIPPVIKHPTPMTTMKEAGPPGSGLVKQIKDSYRNAVLVDEVKRKDTKAMNKFKSQLKTSPNKLYDKPPSKRTGSN